MKLKFYALVWKYGSRPWTGNPPTNIQPGLRFPWDFQEISSVAQVFSRMATESERFIATSSLAMRSERRQTLQKFREKPLSKPSDKTKAFSIWNEVWHEEYEGIWKKRLLGWFTFSFFLGGDVLWMWLVVNKLCDENRQEAASVKALQDHNLVLREMTWHGLKFGVLQTKRPQEWSLVGSNLLGGF